MHRTSIDRQNPVYQVVTQGKRNHARQFDSLPLERRNLTDLEIATFEAVIGLSENTKCEQTVPSVKCHNHPQRPHASPKSRLPKVLRIQGIRCRKDARSQEIQRPLSHANTHV
jgi:hypothetical protein